MKIALAQLDYTVNHIDGNRRKIVEAIRQARERHVDLVVFSELSICGYPPYDLLHSEDFIKHCNAAISEIAKH
ncbi:MAG: nitrilase-related carbon-nitrogen hydrolase, partial [Tenuifilaceae bacterium]